MHLSEPVLCGFAALWLATAPASAAFHDDPELPPFFELVPDQGTYFVPTGMAFADDGSYFVIDKAGRIHFHDGTAQQAQLFLDLRDEVNPGGDRGLLGVAVYPGFVPDGGATSWVYLLYTVSPVFGENTGYDENDQYSFSRLTRYRATRPAGAGTDVVADLASRDVVLGSQLADGTVPDGIASLFDVHANGSLRFADDGSLLLSAGDGAHHDDPGGLDPPGFENFVHPQTSLRGPMPQDQDSGAFRAQDTRSLSGKVLRIDPETGLGYPSNPFFDGDPASNASKVWALGLRNPFRFNIRPGTGALDPALGQPGTVYIGDVGWGTWEELDVCKGGENFGWPCFEGPAPNAIYQAYTSSGPPFDYPDCAGTNPGTPTLPVVAWNRSDPGLVTPSGFHFDAQGQPASGFVGSSAIGGVHYPGGGSYPAEYDGRFFFSDYSHEWVKTLETDAQDVLVGIRDFGEHVNRLVDMHVHPLDGDVYFLLMEEDFNGHVYHLRYDDNLTPVADIDAQPTQGPPPLVVQFDATGSTDGNNDPLDYLWDFGDGSPASTAPVVQHTYPVDGVFSATLTVSDPGGATSVAEVTILAGNTAPVATLEQPVNGRLFRAGESIDLVGSGQDAQGPITGFEWTVDLHHNNHVHPSFFSSSQAQAVFVAEDHGSLGDAYFYEVHFTVRDEDLVEDTQTVFILPADRIRDPSGTSLPISHLDALDPPHSTGAGNPDVEVVRDAIFPAAGTQDPSQQLDTRHTTPVSEHWVGFELACPPGDELRFVALTFQEGMHFATGGWFEQLSVDVREGGVWNAVQGLTITPAYPFHLAGQPSFDGVSFDTYELRFDPAHGDAVRLRGDAGGTQQFVSIGELRAKTIAILPDEGPLLDVTDQAEIVARLFELDPPVPLGRGNVDPETIRNGTWPPLSSTSDFGQFDTFHFGDQGSDDWIGYRFAAPHVVSRIVFQEGRHTPQGGRFGAVDVEVQVDDASPWVPVSGLAISPAYPGSADLSASYEIFTLDFDATLAKAVRLRGGLTGSIGYVSVGELRVFADPPVDPSCQSYCSANPNATGSAATITCSGDPASSLVLTSTPVPNSLGQFFYGNMMLLGNPFGDGFLCVGGMTQRIFPFVSAGMMMQPPNTATFAVDYAAPYATGLIGTRHFQHWFRSGLVTGAGFNTSDAVSVTF